MTIENLKASLTDGKIKNIILDTDTYNEIDDQYALAYAMLASDKVRLMSVNAAPFLNSRSTSPADGMEKSYNEIFRVMNLVNPDAKIPVYRGSTQFMTAKDVPVESEAADNIINTVMNSEDPVYIVAIGAITNVASAIVKCPEIVNRAALVWLGGHSFEWPNTKEFNMFQDMIASSVVFDSGIPMIQIPCCGVCSNFATTIPELEYYLRGKNDLCDYLVDNVVGFRKANSVWSKVIWDVTAIGVLALPAKFSFITVPRPRLSSDGYYIRDLTRAPYIYVRWIQRDPLFADLFTRLIEKKI